jgi:hypothetical protein
MQSRLFLLSLILLGCSEFSDIDTDTDTEPQDDIAVLGDWVDNWGQSHTISNTSWNTEGALFALSQYDNDEGWAVGQNGEDNTFSPNLWSRFDWITVDSTLWYCQSTYDAETEDGALTAAPVDASDPANTGCGGDFSWSSLIPVA